MKHFTLLQKVSVATVAAVSLAGCTLGGQPKKESAPTPSPTPNSEVNASTAPVMEKKPVPAGSKVVTSSASYDSPAGEEAVAFELVVDADGIITQANTTVLGKAPITIKRQEAFAAGLPTLIVGKKISEVEALDKVGGSSLTTGAFNAALEDLQKQASM